MYLHIPMSKGGERRDRKEKKKRERLELQQLHSKVNISVPKIGGGSAPTYQKVGWGGGALAPLAPTSSHPNTNQY